MKYYQKSVIAFIGATALAIYAKGNIHAYSLCAFAMLFISFIIVMMSFSNQIKARELEELKLFPSEHISLITKGRKQLLYGFIILFFALVAAVVGQVLPLLSNSKSHSPISPQEQPKNTEVRHI